MEILKREGEIPVGLCKRKLQSVAFTCPESHFHFLEFSQLKCWRVDDTIVGLARLPKGVRNGVWHRLLKDATWYQLDGRSHWAEVENAFKHLDEYESGTQRQAYNDAKRALRIFREGSRGRHMRDVVEECRRSYLAGLRVTGP